MTELIGKRVAWLRDHAEDRKELLEMTRAIWRMIEPEWQKFGKQGAEQAARDLSSRIRPDADIRALVPGNKFVHKETFAADIASARARGELVLVPLGLAGGGQFYWAFPGLVPSGPHRQRGA